MMRSNLALIKSRFKQKINWKKKLDKYSNLIVYPEYNLYYKIMKIPHLKEDINSLFNRLIRVVDPLYLKNIISDDVHKENILAELDLSKIKEFYPELYESLINNNRSK